jgi:hypothetical protein
VANKVSSTGTTWAEVCAEAAKAPDVGDVPYVLEIASTKLDKSLEKLVGAIKDVNASHAVIKSGSWVMEHDGGSRKLVDATQVKQTSESETPPVLVVKPNMHVVISRPGADTSGALGRLLGPVAMGNLCDDAKAMRGFAFAIHAVVVTQTALSP